MPERVTLHPFSGFVEDSLGESTKPEFGADESLFVFGVDPGSTGEPIAGIDTAVRDAPTLYFRRGRVESSPHSEWSVRGVRYQQDGEPRIWVSPWGGATAGTVIYLERRSG